MDSHYASFRVALSGQGLVMSVELSMTSGESLTRVIALLKRQGLDAMPRKSRQGYP